VIALEDCIALCGLTAQEVVAIAEHEHVPEIAATAMGRYLLNEPRGADKIRDMIRDDIRAALRRDDRDHARELFMALRHFLNVYPAARQRRSAANSFSAFREPDPMAAANVGCSRCGLVMTIAQRPGDPTLSYDREEWNRLCKTPECRDPTRCAAEHDIDISARAHDRWGLRDWRICKDSTGLSTIC
jgi:hypothetical protein